MKFITPATVFQATAATLFGIWQNNVVAALFMFVFIEIMLMGKKCPFN